MKLPGYDPSMGGSDEQAEFLTLVLICLLFAVVFFSG